MIEALIDDGDLVIMRKVEEPSRISKRHDCRS